jgi:hypothetical protein
MTAKKQELETELAALRERVAELEAKAKPPEPFKETPYQRYDPTAGMSMPPSALAAMVAAVPDSVMRDVIRDNRGAPTGPTTMAPSSSSQGGGPTNVPGSGTGWAHEAPLSNPPGTNYADRLMDAQDAKDRHERIVQDAQMKAMEKLAEKKS